ncbi:MAG: hypothetical protein MJ053_06460 [Elusimicrobiaceae bacterium]|nr:hypothetical protein [Elusimicrobiaceae bacterium]
MKRVLVMCVMCLCSVFAMGQTGEIEKAVKEAVTKALTKVVTQQATTQSVMTGMGRVRLNIPLVVPSGVQITGTATEVTSTYLKARKAAERLTPTQRTLLGVRGFFSFVRPNPEAFGWSLGDASCGEVATVKCVWEQQEDAEIARRVDWLKKSIRNAQQYSSYVEAQMSNASKPMDGEPLAKWTVSQLPKSEELDSLCIGEENAFMLKGPTFMDNLLTEIRAKYPEREIVLLTSFLPNQTVLFPGDEALISEDYRNQIWNSALRNNITVVGADVSTTMQTSTMNIEYDDLQTGEVVSGVVSTNETATGQQMQHEHFFRLMDEIKGQNLEMAANQEILFVLYGRPVNMLYNGFASVPARLDQQHQRVKVIHIAPASGVDVAGMPTDITTSMEKILPDNLAKLLSQQRAMAWQPLPGRLRYLMHKFSGSDIRLKVNRN